MLKTLPQRKIPAYLEQVFGHPYAKDNSVFSVDKTLLDDEASVFPQTTADVLHAHVLHHYFIPKQYGGKLDQLDEFVLVFRAIQRRDPTLALGFGLTTFMASIVVWLFGSADQRQALALMIKSKHTVSVAFHEQAHGNDVLGASCEVFPQGDSYLVNGEKWVINNIRESMGLVLFARTDPKGGARGFSTLFLNKQVCDRNTLRYKNKIKTLGVRGCRIAGVTLDKTELSNADFIGKPGLGFEQTIKSFQITKTVIAGVAIGSLDTYLRLVLDVLHREQLSTYAQQICVDAWMDIVLCDSLALTMARALHVIPMEMSLYSQVTKYFIANQLQKALRSLKKIAGFAALLREGESALLQKIERDFSVVNLGHASSDICLNGIALQLKNVLHASKTSADIDTVFKTLFTLHLPLPALDAGALKIDNLGKDSLLFGFKQGMQRWGALCSSSMRLQLQCLEKAYDDLKAATLHWDSKDEGRGRSFAKQYAAIVAGVCVFMIWHFAKTEGFTFLKDDVWVEYSLSRILQQALPQQMVHVSTLYSELVLRHRHHTAFDLLSMPLGEHHDI